MNNFQAIMRMDEDALAQFLSQIYITGLNTGLYAATQPENDSLLEENPFAMSWLHADAERATLNARSDTGERNLLDALSKAVLREAGIEDDDNGNDD